VALLLLPCNFLEVAADFEMAEDEEVELDEEQKAIAEEYSVWRTNTWLMYDVANVHTLEWPSLTCEWLSGTIPEGSVPVDDGNSYYHILLGTHTSDGEPNYLLVTEVSIPDEIDVRSKPDGSSAGFFKGDNKHKIKMRIRHEGEVNRARAMPQNNVRINSRLAPSKGYIDACAPKQMHVAYTISTHVIKKHTHLDTHMYAFALIQKLVATKSPSNTVFVFDLAVHPDLPVDDIFKPQHKCHGHEGEGYGLCWSPLDEGHLLSGSGDSIICMWDLREAGADVAPLHKIPNAHGGGSVEDVAWHFHYEYLFGSAGDDSNVLLWDRRKGFESPSHRLERAHKSDVRCLSFNPYSEFLFATGGADGSVALWDLRNLDERLHLLEGHTNEVQQVSWAPFSESILGSCGADRRVHIWDVAKIGDEQKPEEGDGDVPPELIFTHAGHTSKVLDFSWNKEAGWLVASVDQDNKLHVWEYRTDLDEEVEEVKDEDLEAPEEGEGDSRDRKRHKADTA